MSDGGLRDLERRASGGDTTAQKKLGLEYLRIGDHQTVLDNLACFRDEDSLTAMSTSLAVLCEDTPMLPPSDERLARLLSFTENLLYYGPLDLQNLHNSQIGGQDLYLNWRDVAQSLHTAGEALLPLWTVLQGRSAAYECALTDIDPDIDPRSYFMRTATDMWVAFKGDKVKFVPRCWNVLAARWTEQGCLDNQGYFALRPGEYERLSGPELPRVDVVNHDGFYKKDIAAAKRHLGWIALCEGKKNVWEEYVDRAFEARTKRNNRRPILKCLGFSLQSSFTHQLIKENPCGLIYSIGLEKRALHPGAYLLHTTAGTGTLATNRHRSYTLNNTPVRR